MSDRYSEHRSRLAEVIGSEGLAIIPASHEVIRNYDVTHEFRQDSAFWYLTGFPEPEAVAVMTPGHDDGDFHLFVPPKDPSLEVWTGIRAGTEGALATYGADTAYELSELDSVLARLMIGREVLWYTTGDDKHDARVAGIVKKARAHRERNGGVVPSSVKDVSVPLGEMMLIKDSTEIESLRRACRLSAEGHAEAMRFTEPGMHEYEVQTALEYYWRLEGSPRNGYPSIVAGGANACILHYVENNKQIGPDDLVLIDAAAEIDGYSSDITRTYPANGSFTGPQRAVYEVVLASQKAGVQLSTPGSTMRAIHDECTRILTEGMVELGLLPKSVDESLSMHHYSQFYMHGTGHWLGLDVHDRGAYKVEGVSRPLQIGMVFTVEPGLYVGLDKETVELSLLEYDLDDWGRRRIELGPAAAAALEAEEKAKANKITHEVPRELVGIGVRIEDDILITQDGHENMTDSVPRGVEDVEALCAETSSLPRR